MRNAVFLCLNSRLRRFGANFSILSNQLAPVKLSFRRNQGHQPVRAAQKIKERPAQCARATKARGRLSPGSCNGLFSLGIPSRGLRRGSKPASTNPTNQLPNSLDSCPTSPNRGRPTKLASGHREAPLLTNNSLRVAQGVPARKHLGPVNHLYLQHRGNYLPHRREFRRLACGRPAVSVEKRLHFSTVPYSLFPPASPLLYRYQQRATQWIISGLPGVLPT